MATSSSQGDSLDAILQRLHKLNRRCDNTLKSLSAVDIPSKNHASHTSGNHSSNKDVDEDDVVVMQRRVKIALQPDEQSNQAHHQEAHHQEAHHQRRRLSRMNSMPDQHALEVAEASETLDADLIAPVKYRKAFFDGPNGPEALTFFGLDNIETKITDFDLVFVFRNPGHLEEFSKLASSASAGCDDEERKNIEAAINAVREEQESADHAFLEGLISKEEKRQQGNGPKIMLRCSSCGFPRDSNEFVARKSICLSSFRSNEDTKDVCPKCDANWEEVLKKCGKCSRKIDYDKTMCSYCRCKDLQTKTFPIVSKVEDMDHEAIGLFSEELLRDFFSDPRQGDQLHASNDITNLQDMRRAVIDIFLSFFRAQDQDEYYTYLFKSVDFDELFLCVKMSDKTAKQHAETQQFCCMLDTSEMTKPIEDGGMHIKYDNTFQRYLICNEFLSKLARCCRRWGSRMAHINPAMSGGAVQYEPGMEKLLVSYPEESTKRKESVFKKADRIRLLYDKVTDVLSVEDMVKWNLLSTFFPLHTKETLITLKNKWARIGLAYKYTQPMENIKDYFGPHIALYFIFLEHMLKYSLFLVALSIVIMVVDFIKEVRNDFSTSQKNPLRFLGGAAGYPDLRVVWSLFVILWCQLFQIRLKRKVTTACNLWGLDGNVSSTVKNELNPRFSSFATITESELNENEMVFNVPWEQKQRGRFMAQVSTVVFVVFTTLCSLGILKMQSNLYEAKDFTWSSRMSFVLTIEIKILNTVWIGVGQWLVDREYWSERLHYDNAIAYKNFYVQLVTTFVAFYYIAFAMHPLGDDSYGQYGGTHENGHFIPSKTPWCYLTFQMCYTFGLYLVFAVYDLLSPLISMWWTRRQERKTLSRMREENWEYSFIELQSKMAEYDGDLQNDDYMQILLPYGFVLFFGATLPISALLCWIYTSLQLRVDAWKLCHAMRRPYPRNTRPGAWVWEDIIDVFMSLVAVTNIGLVCFVMRPCRDKSITFRWSLFFGLIVFTSLINRALLELYPTISDIVHLARRRHEYQREAAKKMFFDRDQNDFLQLHANRDIMFDARVGRLRRSTYQSKNHDVMIDRSLVDKVFQPEMPWLAKVPEPEP